MSISSSLNAGVSGLAVNGSRLSAISDNIANSGTNGYKRASVEFASVVTGQQEGRYSAGGVRSASVREVDVRGALITTANSTDIAVTGRGLLPVTPITNRDDPALSRPLNLVTTGSFTPDDEGYLVTASGLQLLGWPTDTSGNVAAGVIRASGASLEPVRIAGIDFASNPTTEMELGINLPVGETTFGSAGTPISTGVEYFDALGTAQTLTMTFTPIPATAAGAPSSQWSLAIADSAGGTPLTTSPLYLEFNNTGANAGFLTSVSSVAPGVVGYPAAPAATLYDGTSGLLTLDLPTDIAVTIGALNATGPLTQFDSSFAPVAVTKNGTPVGGLSRVEVLENGKLEAVYDTGFRQVLYQVPIANVPNLNGLLALDNQSFAISAESGNVFLWDAGNGPVGGMTGFSLEQSATDIAGELTNLIETQRAYSSNATIIRTVDEMLQETTNLKR